MHRSVLLATCAMVAAAPVFAAEDEDLGRGDEVFDDISVTALPSARSSFDTFQATSLLRGDALKRNLSTTLGESLDLLPGISQSFFGPGSSRPLIRGLGGDRIRVLVGGIGTLDVSTTSVDHQSAVDLTTAEAVEVIRGPASLLYGTNAAGGIINIVDGRIPQAEPEDGFDVKGGATYGTVAEEFMVNGDATAALGGGFVANFSASYTNSDDYDIPGFLESAAFRAMEEEEHGDEDDHDDDDDDHDHDEEEEEEIFGTAPNSATENLALSGGISRVGDWGFFGVSVSYYDSTYGIPAGHEHGHEHGDEDEDHDDDDDDHEGEEEGEEEEDITIDLEQIRIDLAGEYRFDGGFLEKAKVRFAWADYEQTEFEGDGIGTVFDNKEWEGRIELVQTQSDVFSGSFGVQVRSRDFSAIGAEAFVPPNETTQYGIFAAQRLDKGPYSFDLGLRFDRQNSESDFIPSEDGNLPGVERDFSLFNVSAAASVTLNDTSRIGLNVFRTERAPNSEELFSNGPHLATQVFEIGDVNLSKETAIGAELTLRHNGDIFEAEVAGFYTGYNNFIFERFTGEEEDGLPVAIFTAADATFYGIEAFGRVNVLQNASHSAHVELGADFVRGDNDDANESLPRIPPYSLRGAIDYEAQLFDARLDMTYSGIKNRVATFETETEDFFRMDFTVDVHPFEDKDISFVAQVRNITDEEIRYHASFLKDMLPAPGRDFRFSVRASF